MRLLKSLPFFLLIMAISAALTASYLKYCPLAPKFNKVSKTVAPALKKEVLPIAYSSARWGMSVSSVERANGKALLPKDNFGRFYSPKPNGPDISRYSFYECDEEVFLGRQAKVRYLFLDGKLFSFHLFVQDADAELLQADIEKYLSLEFGDRPVRTEDESSSLKMIWNLGDRVANYWFFEESLSMQQKFTAGFGVVYRPLE